MAFLTGRYKNLKVPGSGMFSPPERTENASDAGGMQDGTHRGGLVNIGRNAERAAQEQAAQEQADKAAADAPGKEAARNAAMQAANAGARLFAQTQVATEAANRPGEAEVDRATPDAVSSKRRGRFRTQGPSDTIRI